MNEEKKVYMPKSAPGWAVGVVTILLAIGGLYELVRNEVEKAVNLKVEHGEHIDNLETTTVNKLLDLVTSNNQQITNQSAALNEANRTVNSLSERVASLEKDKASYDACLGNLSSCEEKLKNCKR